MTYEIKSDRIDIPAAPALPGLIFRHYRGEDDLPGILAALNASERADGDERLITLEEITDEFRHPNNCNLLTDLVIAEVDGEIAGYSRVEWWQNEARERIYSHFGYLKPVWRRQGIGSALLGWAQSRLRDIAGGQPDDGPKLFETFSTESNAANRHLLEGDGYLAVRYGFFMIRPDLDNIPSYDLPAGIEVRPVLPEHYRAIWEADVEAFRDHWGFAQPTDTHYQAWLDNRVTFTPALWKIAWDVQGIEICGQVRGFVHEAENRNFKRLRGYCEFISVRRPWRKRGVARALIAATLREFKARGLTEAALGVDAENLSGALRVYQDCGFQVVKRATVYRKKLG